MAKAGSQIRTLQSGRNDINIDRSLAAQFSTPPEALEQLSQSSDRLTRSAVALNANSSLKTICRLADEFPEQFVNNPALERHFVENKELLNELSDDGVCLVLQHPECPKYLTLSALEVLRMEPRRVSIALGIIRNKNTDINTLIEVASLAPPRDIASLDDFM